MLSSSAKNQKVKTQNPNVIIYWGIVVNKLQHRMRVLGFVSSPSKNDMYHTPYVYCVEIP